MANVDIDLSPPHKKPRFASVDLNRMEQILKEKDSINTQKATARSMRLFTKYLEEKDMPTDITEYPIDELDKVLAQFYTEARSEKGELYRKTTLKNTRYGIQRYISEKLNIDIIKDKEFNGSNKVFQAMSVQLKREGLGGIEHYPPVEEDVLQKIYNSLDDKDPVSLQQKVFMDIMLYFGRRGRENLRELKKCDFEVSKSITRQGGGDKEVGHRYVRIKRDELTKNHKNDSNTAVGKMYEVEGDAKCPLQSFLKYMSKLNERCDFFFQRPKRNITDESLWYDAVPLGHNTLGSMMPSICDKAGIEKRYTNHSLRATAVHVLDVAEFAGRHIMSITGHKSENSLKTYTGYTSDKALKKMSNVISGSVRSQTVTNPETLDNNSPPSVSTTNTVIPVNEDFASIFENDENISDFLLLSNSQMETLVQSVANVEKETVLNNQQITSNEDNQQLLAAPLNNQQLPVATNTHPVSQVLNNTSCTSYNYGYPNQFPIITNNYGSININYNILPN